MIESFLVDSPPDDVVMLAEEIGMKNPFDTKWEKKVLPLPARPEYQVFCQCSMSPVEYVENHAPFEGSFPTVSMRSKGWYYLGQCEKCETIFWSCLAWSRRKRRYDKGGRD